ncbi:hypothetical protein [Streptomyces decoyicus]|uniref:hypothetical protein n=1 Tax=Streptomyces decoyicus TaxID=249567 RepID=UPI003F5294DC
MGRLGPRRPRRTDAGRPPHGPGLTLSGLGLVHGIGHALTAHTGTPHGVALAAVLEEVMVFSAPAARDAYEQAGRAMRLAPPADGDWARATVRAVREISGTAGHHTAVARTGRRPRNAAGHRRGSGRGRGDQERSAAAERGGGAGDPHAGVLTSGARGGTGVTSVSPRPFDRWPRLLRALGPD